MSGNSNIGTLGFSPKPIDHVWKLWQLNVGTLGFSNTTPESISDCLLKFQSLYFLSQCYLDWNPHCSSGEMRVMYETRGHNQPKSASVKHPCSLGFQLCFKKNTGLFSPLQFKVPLLWQPSYVFYEDVKPKNYFSMWQQSSLVLPLFQVRMNVHKHTNTRIEEENGAQ